MSNKKNCILLNSQGDEIAKIKIEDKSRKIPWAEIFAFINIIIMFILAIIVYDYTKHKATCDAAIIHMEKVHPLEASIVLNEEFKNLRTRKTYACLNHDQEKFYTKVFMVVNYYNHLCVGYNSDVYDKKLFKKYLGASINLFWKVYKHFIELSKKEGKVSDNDWVAIEIAVVNLARE